MDSLVDFRLNALWRSRQLGRPAPCPNGVSPSQKAAWSLGIEDFTEEMAILSRGVRARHLPGALDNQLALRLESAQKSHRKE